MKFFFTIIFFLFSFHAYSQKISDTAKRTKLLQFLYEPINQYKDQLICNEHGKGKDHYSDTSTCRNYQYIRAKKDPLRFSNVYFTEVEFEYNVKKVINNVMYIKSYLTTDSFLTEKQLDVDYLSLYDYFIACFKKKGTKKIYTGNYFTDKTLTWEFSDIRYILDRTDGKTRPDGKRVSSIQIAVQAK